VRGGLEGIIYPKVWKGVIPLGMSVKSSLYTMQDFTGWKSRFVDIAYSLLNSKPIECWKVGAIKVATEEGSNLLSS